MGHRCVPECTCQSPESHAVPCPPMGILVRRPNDANWCADKGPASASDCNRIPKRVAPHAIALASGSMIPLGNWRAATAGRMLAGEEAPDDASIRPSASLSMSLCIAAVLAFAAGAADKPAPPAAKPFLHPLFSSDMVLQRGMPTPYGAGGAGTESDGTNGRPDRDRDCGRGREVDGGDRAVQPGGPLFADHHRAEEMKLTTSSSATYGSAPGNRTWRWGSPT